MENERMFAQDELGQPQERPYSAAESKQWPEMHWGKFQALDAVLPPVDGGVLLQRVFGELAGAAAGGYNYYNGGGSRSSSSSSRGGTSSPTETRAVLVLKRSQRFEREFRLLVDEFIAAQNALLVAQQPIVSLSALKRKRMAHRNRLAAYVEVLPFDGNQPAQTRDGELISQSSGPAPHQHQSPDAVSHVSKMPDAHLDPELKQLLQRGKNAPAGDKNVQKNTVHDWLFPGRMWMGEIRMPGAYGEHVRTPDGQEVEQPHNYYFTVQDGLNVNGAFVAPLTLENNGTGSGAAHEEDRVYAIHADDGDAQFVRVYVDREIPGNLRSYFPKSCAFSPAAAGAGETLVPLAWHDKETYCFGALDLRTGRINGDVRQLQSGETEGYWEPASKISNTFSLEPYPSVGRAEKVLRNRVLTKMLNLWRRGELEDCLRPKTSRDLIGGGVDGRKELEEKLEAHLGLSSGAQLKDRWYPANLFYPRRFEVVDCGPADGAEQGPPSSGTGTSVRTVKNFAHRRDAHDRDYDTAIPVEQIRLQEGRSSCFGQLFEQAPDLVKLVPYTFLYKLQLQHTKALQSEFLERARFYQAVQFPTRAAKETHFEREAFRNDMLAVAQKWGISSAEERYVGESTSRTRPVWKDAEEFCRLAKTRHFVDYQGFPEEETQNMNDAAAEKKWLILTGVREDLLDKTFDFEPDFVDHDPWDAMKSEMEIVHARIYTHALTGAQRRQELAAEQNEQPRVDFNVGLGLFSPAGGSFNPNFDEVRIAPRQFAVTGFPRRRARPPERHFDLVTRGLRSSRPLMSIGWDAAQEPHHVPFDVWASEMLRGLPLSRQREASGSSSGSLQSTALFGNGSRVGSATTAVSANSRNYANIFRRFCAYRFPIRNYIVSDSHGGLQWCETLEEMQDQAAWDPDFGVTRDDDDRDFMSCRGDENEIEITPLATPRTSSIPSSSSSSSSARDILGADAMKESSALEHQGELQLVQADEFVPDEDEVEEDGTATTTLPFFIPMPQFRRQYHQQMQQRIQLSDTHLSFEEHRRTSFVYEDLSTSLRQAEQRLTREEIEDMVVFDPLSSGGGAGITGGSCDVETETGGGKSGAGDSGNEEQEEEAPDCMICLGPILMGRKQRRRRSSNMEDDAEDGGTTNKDMEKIVRLPNCGHYLHFSCAVEWLHGRQTCPIMAATERRNGSSGGSFEEGRVGASSGAKVRHAREDAAASSSDEQDKALLLRPRGHGAANEEQEQQLRPRGNGAADEEQEQQSSTSSEEEEQRVELFGSDPEQTWWHYKLSVELYLTAFFFAFSGGFTNVVYLIRYGVFSSVPMVTRVKHR
eukprot:g7008.t1